MHLVAKASKTVRNKNSLLLIMVAVFAVWFSYDAWVGYPATNDRLVQQMIAGSKLTPPRGLTTEEGEDLEAHWPKGGWNDASPEQREDLSKLVERKSAVSGWHTVTDILVQRVLAVGLCVAFVYCVYWFSRCQKRRVIADDTALSPANGVNIPWSHITKVDNMRWKKTGIVDLEYRDADGQARKAVLDDYLVDNLVPILEELAQRADKAEFVNPPEAARSSEAAK